MKGGRKWREDGTNRKRSSPSCEKRKCGKLGRRHDTTRRDSISSPLGQFRVPISSPHGYQLLMYINKESESCPVGGTSKASLGSRSSPNPNKSTDIKARRSTPGEAERPCGESCGRRYCRIVSDYAVSMASSWSSLEVCVFETCQACNGLHSSIRRSDVQSTKRSLQQCFCVS